MNSRYLHTAVHGCILLLLFSAEAVVAVSSKTRALYHESCNTYFQDVVASRSILDPDRKGMYFLAKMGRERDKKRSWNIYRYFKLDLESVQAQKVFEITVGDIDYIISQSDPNMGVMLIDQKDELNDCNAGIADYLFLSLRKYRVDWQGQHTMSGREHLAPIKTAEGFAAFNLNESSFILFDPSSMQKRSNAALVGSAESMQFINTPSRPTSNYYTVVDNPEKSERGLVFYKSSERGANRLSLKTEERAIRYQSFVAVALFNHAQNKVRLTFSPRWSHMATSSSSIVEVAGSQRVGKARYMIDKDRMHLIVIGGGSNSRGKDLELVRVYDILRNRMLSYFKVPLGSKIGFVNLIPESGYVVLETLNRDGFSESIYYSSVNTGWQWRNMRIPRD